MPEPPDSPSSSNNKLNVQINVDSNHGAVTGVQTVHGDIHVHSSEERDKSLDLLLLRVKQFWIEGFLKTSLYNQVLIDLELINRPEAVTPLLGKILEVQDNVPETVSPSKSITEVFDETGRSMLILGEPGSGKTITLLNLAKELIIRA